MFAILLLVLQSTSQPSCFRANVDTVALTGVLGRRTSPGAPNFESTRRGDLAEQGLYLSLTKAICTVDDSVAGPKSNVQLVQLVLDSAGSAFLKNRLGQRVTIRGTLFGAHTGHHHADLLLAVIAPPPRTSR